MRRQVGRAVLAALRYRIVGEPPQDPAYVLVAAPHTSWLDLPLMLGIAWASGIEPGFLAKKELFRPPFGAMLRGVGAIRVAYLMRAMESSEPMALMPFAIDVGM